MQLLESDDAESPTIFGWWHPTLLLPLGLQERLDLMQLRYVLLHELAHVRRNDVLINWIAAIAQLLHWFNPIVWLATRLMRSDMECACDASVLHRLSEAERGRYGDMLVQLADSHGAAPAQYALGVVDGHADLKGRLIMIARFGSASTPTKVAALVALAAFTLVALVQPGFTAPSGAESGAAQGAASAVPNAPAASPSSQQPRKKGVPITVLIEQVARNIHKRVIVDPRIVSSTVFFYGQSLDQITYSDFLTMLRINRLTAVEVNNYINVIPDTDVRMMPLPDMPTRGELPEDQYANMSIELTNACAYSLVPILRPLIPPSGDLVASSSDTILAIGTYANLKRIRSIATELDNRAKPGDRCGKRSASTATLAAPAPAAPTAASETSAPPLRRVSAQLDESGYVKSGYTSCVRLSGHQEVPPVETDAWGDAVIRVRRDRTITGTIATHGIQGTMAYIQQGWQGTRGPTILTLQRGPGDTWAVPANSKFIQQQYASFLAARLYVIVDSAAHPDGEIRAQLIAGICNGRWTPSR